MNTVRQRTDACLVLRIKIKASRKMLPHILTRFTHVLKRLNLAAFLTFIWAIIEMLSVVRTDTNTVSGGRDNAFGPRWFCLYRKRK